MLKVTVTSFVDLRDPFVYFVPLRTLLSDALECMY